MRALTVFDDKNAAFVEAAPPVPAAGEAVVRSRFTAICGTDVKLFSGDLHDADYPVVPGHEWVGVVESAPDRPELVGKLVTGSNFITCDSCEHCRNRLPQLCVELDEIGFTRPGAFAELFTIPTENLVLLPPERISPEAACLLEPLCVALHARDRARLQQPDSVAVLGGGTVGQLIAQLCTAAGLPVLVLEPSAERRAVAAELGLRATDPGEAKFDDGAPNVVFDATGNPSAFRSAVDLVGVSGRVVLVGYSGLDEIGFPPSLLMLKQLEIVGVLSGYGYVPTALETVLSGAVRLEPLVTHCFPVDEYREAVSTASDPAAAAMRVVLRIGEG